MAVDSEGTRIRVEDKSVGVRRNQDEEVIRRFRDLRRELRQRATYEVTNQQVLSILLDCYFVHRENEAVPFERLRSNAGERP